MTRQNDDIRPLDRVRVHWQRGRPSSLNRLGDELFGLLARHNDADGAGILVQGTVGEGRETGARPEFPTPSAVLPKPRCVISIVDQLHTIDTLGRGPCDGHHHRSTDESAAMGLFLRYERAHRPQKRHAWSLLHCSRVNASSVGS